MPQTILDRILETKRKEVARLHERWDLAAMKHRAADAPPARNFFKAVTGRPRGRVNLIAEVKKASPSAGLISPDFDPVRLGRSYAAAGADALSVLTDETYFQGSLADLSAVREVVELPILRKDFFIDPLQVYEARAAGADAILLIAAALPAGSLLDLMLLATELRMTSLIEVHTVEELMAVRSVVGFGHQAYSVLGINNRDLTTFQVDLRTTLRLSSLAVEGTPIVSESGIRTAEDVRRLADGGVCAILVGETLMRSGNVAEKIATLLGFDQAHPAEA